MLQPEIVHALGAIEDDGSLTLVGMASDHATIHRVPLGEEIVCSRSLT